MRKFIASLTLFYPVVLWGFKGNEHFYWIALGFGSLLILELVTRMRLQLQVLSFLALFSLVVLMRFAGLDNEARFYPFLMSLSMLLLFASSREPRQNPMFGPFKKRFSADPRMVLAMHEAKLIWIVGLGLNTIALFVFLFWGTEESWILFAGFWSYVWLLTLFLLSVIYVHFRKRRPLS